jgi:hypothetical protein
MSYRSGSSSRAIRNRIAALACLTVNLLYAQIAHSQSYPKDAAPSHGSGYSSVIPYNGRIEDALAASATGQTIPMASHTFTATKDGNTYTDVFVGATPFEATKGTTTVNLLIVPVIVVIGSTTFDPTVPDPCIYAGLSPLQAFQQSPVFSKVVFDGGDQNGHAATVNGVNVGTTIYSDAFRRAEYWKEVANTDYHTLFNVTVAPSWTISASEVESLGGGNVFSTLCANLGVLNEPNFEGYIQNTVIPSIPAITPTTFALFLMKDVVITNSTALNCLNGCNIGYHGAFGSPVQTYAVSEYDSTQEYWNNSNFKNVWFLAREVIDWMDNPLVTNSTPPWGGIAGEFNCDTSLEPGVPLSGTNFPAIKMSNGLNYNLQEHAFWSWFYNGPLTPSVGAGGKFSNNRSFDGPSKNCPVGGTY